MWTWIWDEARAGALAGSRADRLRPVRPEEKQTWLLAWEPGGRRLRGPTKGRDLLATFARLAPKPEDCLGWAQDHLRPLDPGSAGLLWPEELFDPPRAGQGMPVSFGAFLAAMARVGPWLDLWLAADGRLSPEALPAAQVFGPGETQGLYRCWGVRYWDPDRGWRWAVPCRHEREPADPQGVLRELLVRGFGLTVFEGRPALVRSIYHPAPFIQAGLEAGAALWAGKCARPDCEYRQAQESWERLGVHRSDLAGQPPGHIFWVEPAELVEASPPGRRLLDSLGRQLHLLFRGGDDPFFSPGAGFRLEPGPGGQFGLVPVGTSFGDWLGWELVRAVIRSSGGLRPLDGRACRYCGSSLAETKRSHAGFCSPRCYQNYYYQNRRKLRPKGRPG